MLSRREAIDALVREHPYFQVEERVVWGSPWRVYRQAAPSLRAVFEATGAFGERTFIVFEKDRWTYAEHFRTVAGLAQSWTGEGVGKGDRVAIAMRNYPEMIMSF